MSPMRTTFSLLLAAVALALVTGCGGTGDEDAKAPTREQFIAETDMRCRTSNRRTQALNEDVQRAAAGAQSDEQLVRRLAPILERGRDTVRDSATVFQSTQAPDADASAITRIRAAYDRQAELARKLAAAAGDGDLEQFQALSGRQRDGVAAARRLARDYGFKVCGSTNSDAR